MSKIAVIVDSSSYIPSELKNKYKIYEVPVPIIFNGKIKYDSDWKTLAKFYEDMNSNKEMPTTSQASPADILKTFETAKKDGYDSAIFITMSSGISGMHQNVINLANQFEGLDITVWDSKITVIAEGDQALLAADMAKQNKSLEEILAKLEILRDQSKVFFVVDDISHLKRTGRLSGGIAIVAGILSIKPILTFDSEGKIVAIGKERQMKRAWSWIEKQLADFVPSINFPKRITVVDANNTLIADEWADNAKKIKDVINIDRGIIGSLIGVHTGEKAVGVIVAPDWQYLAEH
ncbi:MAG: DegV family protein [Lactobacillaceae bacterium]|jgi:DegV family protein with EDD domain|nr:DegV family protein [Lactobacillaceae bacterium]